MKTLVTNEALERLYNNLTNSLTIMQESAVDTMMNLGGGQSYHGELKDAPEEIKTANHYFDLGCKNYQCNSSLDSYRFASIDIAMSEGTISKGTIIYLVEHDIDSIHIPSGYYKLRDVTIHNGMTYNIKVYDKVTSTFSEVEYLGESYHV